MPLYYRIVYTPKRGKRQASEEHTFHTQRTPGSPFTFTVTSDSHLDENTSGEVYLRTLANALNDAPDFHLELGDTFMTGKYVQPELSEPQLLGATILSWEPLSLIVIVFRVGKS